MTKETLRVYCISLTAANPTLLIEPLPIKGRFVVANTMDEVMTAVDTRYGMRAGITVDFHGDELLADITTKAKLPSGPEARRESFIRGLRLMADRFVDASDREALSKILGRIQINKKT